jgi:PAS domain S-box-containing protein
MIRGARMGKVAAQPEASAPLAGLEQVLAGSSLVLDLLPVATYICDLAGRIIQYNRRAVDVWGREPAIGDTHRQFSKGAKYFRSDGTELARDEIPMARALATGGTVRESEILIERADGRRVIITVSIDPLVDGQGRRIGAVACFQDITERKRTQTALEKSRSDMREHEQRLAATYEHAAIGISEINGEGRILRVNEAMCAITGRTREQLVGSPLFQRTHPDDIDFDRDAYGKQAAGELGIYSVEKRLLRPDGRAIWVAVRSAPVRDAQGHFLYAVRVVQDISEHKAAEERQKLLVGELNHRVKNTLATVQSLAAQTARHATSPEMFQERFEARLIALSKAHDQLTLRNWQDADLRETIRSAVSPYVGEGASEGRVTLRGEDVMLRPRAALSLALVLHELATNAAKYGALSVPAGKIVLSWQMKADLLVFDWREQGGPPVSKPEQRGFGTRFIEGSVASELNGKAQLDFEPGGLRCTIELPAGAVLADAPSGRAVREETSRSSAA